MKRRKRRSSGKAKKCVMSKYGRKHGTGGNCSSKSPSQCRKAKSCKIGK